MKPIGLAVFGSLMLKTATLLLSALATNNSWPSGVVLKLHGAVPLGALAYRAVAIVWMALPSAALRTLTLVELAQATYSSFPSVESSISVGCLSVAKKSTTFCAARSTTATLALAHRLTYSRLRGPSNRQV